MFDPRTLPYGDFWPNLGAMVIAASFIADVLVAYYYQTYGKKTWTLWIPKAPSNDNKGTFLVWLNGAGRLFIGVGLLAGWILPKLGVYNNAHAWVVFLFAIPGFANTVRNFLLAKKA